MHTNSDAFQQQSFDPANIQCRRCGRYTPWRQTSYWNPQTGEQKSFAEEPGCLIYTVAYVVAFIAIVIVVALCIAGLLYLTGHYNDPLYGDVGLSAYPCAFFGALFAIPAIAAYRERRHKRLRKTYITITHFVCNSCKEQWTITQEPTAK